MGRRLSRCGLLLSVVVSWGVFVLPISLEAASRCRLGAAVEASEPQSEREALIASLKVELVNPYLDEFHLYLPRALNEYDKYLAIREQMLRMIRNQDLSLRLFGHLPSVRPPDEARYLEIIGMYEDRYMQEVIVPRARQYAWAIPNEAAIRTIMKYRPIVEMAAGSGYWAYLLSQAGADVVAYDNDSWNRTEHYRSEKQWFPVRFGDERSIVDHQNRTLLLVWPPGGEFAVELLWRFAGEYLIYVGESSPGVMADAQFFDLLQRDWESVETVDLPHWPGFQDQLTVYHRRLTEDVNWARPIQGRSPRI